MRCGDGVWSFHAVSVVAVPPSQHLCVSTNLDAPQTPWFMDFDGGVIMEA